jgi:hypothetical protein
MANVAWQKACKAMAKAKKKDSDSISDDAMKAILVALGLDTIELISLRTGETDEVKDTSKIDNLDYYWDKDGVFKVEAWLVDNKGLWYGTKASTV